MHLFKSVSLRVYLPNCLNLSSSAISAPLRLWFLFVFTPLAAQTEVPAALEKAKTDLTATLADPFGRLWLSTNRGIGWVREADVEAFARGELRDILSIVYDERDGLVDREGNGGSSPAAALDADGTVPPYPHRCSAAKPHFATIRSGFPKMYELADNWHVCS